MDGIADYEFVRPIGAGNHGRVFLARRPVRLPVEVEHVAVKVLYGPSGVDMFRRASQLLRLFAAARSPYLVTLFDVGQHDGTLYYSMQHLPDGSLARPARALDQGSAVRSVADAVRGAGALHAAGIVHRAIKPSNILLTSYGAKLSEVDLTHIMTPGVIAPGAAELGRVTAMDLTEMDLTEMDLTEMDLTEMELTDPDLLRGEPAGPHHDVWSIGATLHRVVAGTGIYGELPATDGLGMLRSILHTKPEISAELPRPIAEVVGDCLARRSQRPPATAVADEPPRPAERAVLGEGASFAAYEVRRRIAVGGMGEVYLCRHRMLDRLDAVKVLRPHLAADDRFRRRFLREALSVARLRHPNVVSVYTVDEFDGCLYLAMEYVPGEDLSSLLRRDGWLSAARTLGLVRLVADALDAAHRAQLVHRDIKPRNLLVTAAGTARESVTLVDFGISRMLDDDSEITRTGEVVGTIAYCAPEQLSRRGIGGACDQYALACVAYECLTGEVPFPREGQLAVVTAHLTAPPPRVTALRPDLPGGVDDVIARAMAKDPAARFDTCTHFAGAFEAALAPVLSTDHFPAPAQLAARARSGLADLLRPAGDVDLLAFRVGAQSGPPGAAMVVSLLAGPLAVRGEVEPTTACVRWLLAQAVTRHRARDVCLACALAPRPDESWLWVSWLPHARPGAPPVAGPHVATAADTAADLVARLCELVAARKEEARKEEARNEEARKEEVRNEEVRNEEVRNEEARGAAWRTAGRVLAVLDTRLGPRPDDPRLAEAHRLGVHVVYLLAARDVALGMSTLDLSADMASCRLSRAGFPAVEDGVPDAVASTYARELAEALPDE